DLAANAAGATAGTAVVYLSDLLQVEVDTTFADGQAASITASNSGSIDIDLAANAVATNGDASANLAADPVINLDADGNGGDASVSFTNSGTVALNAVAGASGEFADARVDLTGGIELDATVNSTALTFQSAIVSMVNDTAGSIIFSALASATGTSTATGYEAQAFADAGWGVRHEVDNQGNGDAVASLANAGVIGLSATAN